MTYHLTIWCIFMNVVLNCFKKKNTYILFVYDFNKKLASISRNEEKNTMENVIDSILRFYFNFESIFFTQKTIQQIDCGYFILLFIQKKKQHEKNVSSNLKYNKCYRTN